MKQTTLAVTALAALLAVGCTSNEAKKDEAPAPTAAAKAEAPPPPAAKPACPPEPAKTTKKKTTKADTAKTAKTAKTNPPPADCEPAKAKTATSAPAAAPAAEAEPAKGSSTGKACNPCNVKSKDGSFDGEIYGTIPANSKWAKLQIGMHQSEVERILGVSHNVRAYVTGKAFIPFYFGSDRHRYEVVYPGQGSVAYTGGSFGGGMGVLMMINYDAKIQ